MSDSLAEKIRALAWDDPSGLLHRAADELAKLEVRPRVRHKVRGSTYVVEGELEMQISATYIHSGLRAIREGDKITVYRDPETGKLWGRFPHEFNDGRFEPL